MVFFTCIAQVEKNRFNCLEVSFLIGELQGITKGEALKSGEEALTGNVEVLNDDHRR